MIARTPVRLYSCVVLLFICLLNAIHVLYCTLGSTEQASSSSSTSLLRELCVPLVKEDMLGSTLLLVEPLVAALHLVSPTISSRWPGLNSETKVSASAGDRVSMTKKKKKRPFLFIRFSPYLAPQITFFIILRYFPHLFFSFVNVFSCKTHHIKLLSVENTCLCHIDDNLRMPCHITFLFPSKKKKRFVGWTQDTV